LSCCLTNIKYSSCQLCGNPNADLYSLLPESYFKKRKSPHWFLCKECQHKFSVLVRYVGNKILYLHKADYANINLCAMIIKDRADQTIEGIEIKTAPTNSIFIEFNPYLITKYNYRNGSRKGNNGDLRDTKCAICNEEENLTAHHLFKRAVFGESNNDYIITLCTNCHTRIEEKITQMEKQILEPLEGIYYFIQDLLYFEKIKFEDDKYFIIHANKGEQEYSFVLENKKNRII